MIFAQQAIVVVVIQMVFLGVSFFFFSGEFRKLPHLTISQPPAYFLQTCLPWPFN